MMRIACIATSTIPSRTANSIQVMKVCQALNDLGHDLRLWLPGSDPGIPWEGLAEHYGVRGRFPLSWLRSFTPLRRYDFCLRAVLAGWLWGADLFYVWPIQAAAFASQLGLPTALEVHDRPQGRLGPRLFGWFLGGRGRRRLLVTTAALRAWLDEAHGVPLEMPFAVVAPNGVDLERYRGLPDPLAARQALGLRQGFTAGYTGHLYAGRGLDLMVELAQRNPTLLFLWAGGGEAAVQGWRARLVNAGVENLQLLGFVPNERLPLVQAASDVLLMPYERHIAVSGGGDSVAFANPMKVYEYLAAGRAILSSDLPILREVLNEDLALLLPPEDVGAWEAALQALVESPGLRARLAERARREAAKYTWEARARRSLEGLGPTSRGVENPQEVGPS